MNASQGLLVLVTGTGRSGTSTVSGSLHHLGLTVPGPFLGANKSNPKGFFESTWAVQFHRKLAVAARIEDFDSRPEAFELAQAAITPELRSELVDWLTEQRELGDQLVVKDPRSIWVQALWREAAAEVGLSIRYLSMLRHPAETVGSRATYYASKADEARRRRYEVSTAARWLNHSLMNERETRGQPRTFVSYASLLEDWRSVMARVRDDLGLRYDSDLDRAEPHPVDEFIDPDLRRVRVTWDDLDVPPSLRDLTESAWQELLGLPGVADEAPVRAHLDETRLSYERLYADSVAIAHDAFEANLRAGRREGEQEGLEKARKAAQRAADKAAKDSTHLPPAADPADRLVRDVTSAELLRLVGGRLRHRLRS